MWSREMLKTSAKKTYSKYMWSMLLVSFILVLVGSNSGPSLDFDFLNSNSYVIENEIVTVNLMRMVTSIIGVALVAGLAIGIFVFSVIEVGARRFFVRTSRGINNLGDLGYGFKKEGYIGIVATMLIKNIYILLWTLLLIIPGIVKSYAYRMVPYILANNPEIGYNRAIELSIDMTNGQKWEMFVLDLSFIGWYILGALACGIGIYFVNPYRDATEAELYIYLRNQALRDGMTTYRELNMEYE